MTKMRRAPDAMGAARDLLCGLHPSISVRSLDSSYNCMGMIFAARRTVLDTDVLHYIIDDDGYSDLASPDNLGVGDIVLYAADEELTHVAMVVKVGLAATQDRAPDHLLLSQWGFDGEYFHSLHDIPSLYGAPVRYLTDRLRP